MALEIGLGKGYPGASLSNLHACEFTFRGVLCGSIEGVLQAAKKRNWETQKEICKRSGMFAKQSCGTSWRKKQTLWWNGKPMRRDSREYQEFLDELFAACYLHNDAAKRALLASGDATLAHSIGKRKIQDTVLTQQEFISRLTKLRVLLQAGR